MTPLDEARERLQRAVRTGSYAEAQHFLAEYTRAVSAAPAADNITSALDTLHWAGRAVRCERAHSAAKLARLASARPYRPAPPPPAATFHLEA